MRWRPRIRRSAGPPINPCNNPYNNPYLRGHAAPSLTSVDSSANTSIAYAVENEIKSSPLVDPKATQLSPNISPDDGHRHLHVHRERDAAQPAELLIWAGSNAIYFSWSAASLPWDCWAGRAFSSGRAGRATPKSAKLNEIYGKLQEPPVAAAAGQRENQQHADRPRIRKSSCATGLPPRANIFKTSRHPGGGGNVTSEKLRGGAAPTIDTLQHEADSASVTCRPNMIFPLRRNARWSNLPPAAWSRWPRNWAR
jgi:hypothetical protein